MATEEDSPEGNEDEVPGARWKRKAESIRALSTAIAVVIVIGSLLIFGLRLFESRHGLGEFVSHVDECRSKQWFKGLRVGGFCTRECDSNESCGEGFRCVDLHCLPKGTKKVGEACVHAWDCENMICVTRFPSVAEHRASRDKPGGTGPLVSTCRAHCNDDFDCPPGDLCRYAGTAGAWCQDMNNKHPWFDHVWKEHRRLRSDAGVSSP